MAHQPPPVSRRTKPGAALHLVVAQGTLEDVRNQFQIPTNRPRDKSEWLKLLKVSKTSETTSDEKRRYLITELENTPLMLREVFDLDMWKRRDDLIEESPHIARLMFEQSDHLFPTTAENSTLLEAASRKSIPVLDSMVLRLRNSDSETIKRLLETIDKDGNCGWKGGLVSNRNNALQLLVDSAQPRHFQTIKELAKLRPEIAEFKSGFKKLTPLHKAIEDAVSISKGASVGTGLITILIGIYPKALLVRDKFFKPPYSRIKEAEVDTPGSEEFVELRCLLESSIFSSFAGNIAHLRKALYSSDEICKELALDLSDFDLPTHNFSHFVRALNKRGQKRLQFESSLVYLQLPNFNKSPGLDFHEDLPRLFDWLRRQGVKTMYDLRVPDSFSNPVPDETIEELLHENFKIWEFDWRKLDLSIDVIEVAAKDVKRLHLYTTGNWPVLFYWATSNIRRKLLELEELTVTFIEVEGVRTKERLKKAQTDFLTLWNQHEFNSGILKMVDIQRLEMFTKTDDYRPRESQANYTVAKELKLSHDFLRSIAKAQEITALHSSHTQPVKVAIIDNGVDQILSSLSKNITKGQSFVERYTTTENRESPWWIAADPHGTQMASLVLDANPCCELYIAKAGRFRKDLKLSNVVEAIEWAVDQKVDIISMSWVTHEECPDLKKAIDRANKKNILVFCSRADKGNLSQKEYPADFDTTITVSATDRMNVERKHSEKSDFYVVGEDILADGPSYYHMMDGVTSNSVGPAVSGSSVATALAAGLASLIIAYGSCVNKDAYGNRRFMRRAKMVDLMKTYMCPGGANYIQASSFGPGLADENLDNVEVQRAWAVDHFSSM